MEPSDDVLYPLISQVVYLKVSWTLHWFIILQEMLAVPMSRTLSSARGLCELVALKSAALATFPLDRELRTVLFHQNLGSDHGVENIRAMSLAFQIATSIESMKVRH